jgi:hypothetical protein
MDLGRRRWPLCGRLALTLANPLALPTSCDCTLRSIFQTERSVQREYPDLAITMSSWSKGMIKEGLAIFVVEL